MQLEGLIDEHLDYDDWISLSSTWLSLGECVCNEAAVGLVVCPRWSPDLQCSGAHSLYHESSVL
jgi:hypothetical protein